MTPPKLACALVRVSSEEQAKGGYGLQFQEDDIRAFCERNGMELIRVFRDEGYSGASAERPGFIEMMEWARARRFQVLVVWKLDRLFRDTKLTLQTVDELASFDVEVRSVQETFTHDSNGRFLLTIFAAGAEKERRDIALRMDAGRQASLRKGTWIGTPPFGYRYDPEHKRLVIDAEEAKVVRQVFRWLVEERLSLYKVQMRLNDLRIPTKFDRRGRQKPTGSKCWWNKRTIGRILTNEVYRGSFTFRKHLRPSRTHGGANLRPPEDWITTKTPSIIPKSLFERAQAQLRDNRRNSPRRTKTMYLLRGILTCAHDRRRMQAATRRSDRSRECKYYFCTGTRKGYSAVHCPARSVSESRIAPAIWAKVVELLTNPAVVLENLRKFRERTVNVDRVQAKANLLEANKEKIAEKTRRLLDAYLAGAIERNSFHQRNAKLKLEVGDIEAQLRQVKHVLMAEKELAARLCSLPDIFGTYRLKLADASAEVKREIIKLFVKNVVVHGNDLELEVMLPRSSCFAGQRVQSLSHKTALPFIQQMSPAEHFSILIPATLVPIEVLSAKHSQRSS